MFGVAAGIPAWEPQPDVWLLVAALAAGYWIAVVRLGPRFAVPGQPVVTRFQVACWSLGVFATWLVADWPVHVVAEQMNYSVHMVQHLTFAMVAAPLLLLGTPAWLARWIVRPTSRTFRVVRALSRFVPALVVFNVVLVVTHWPALVNESLQSGLVHFGLHALLFVSSLIVWMPVLSPLPEIPRLSTPMRGVYLFSQSVVPTVPASFLTFGAAPLYRFYEGAPHLWGLSTLEDQQVAGLIMKIGAGMLLWALITVFFFRWAADEERHQRPTIRKHLDRELAQLSSP
ncbi:MAG TPA: cytochrome c oxidase assembly protein [Acidimicrobiia bacterium]|nr:cytochrome c oxidase assembly protein [Acidimicrobiia bacterium]